MTDAEKSQAIKRHLAVLGLKQKDVADILGVTRVTVSNLINQPRFGKKTAYAWHSAFGFSVDFLVNGTGPVLSSDAVREPGTITQNITGNSGIAVQQTGGTTNAATGKEAPVQTEGGSATEGYFARHTWGTVARSAMCRVDKGIVHEALCHVDSSMRVTDIYADKDWPMIWAANARVLRLFPFGELA